MEQDQQGEQYLWNAMLRGDKQSFSRIHDRYFGHLLTYAGRFTQDTTLSEECIQDLFVKIWTNRDTLGSPVSIRSYLFKAFRNTLYNKLSRRSKEHQVGSLHDFTAFDLSFSAVSGHDEELLLRVQRLLKSLTPRQQEAIYLFYFEELSYQEVADILQMQIGGVYKLIYRALDNMRAHADVVSILLSLFYLELQLVS